MINLSVHQLEEVLSRAVCAGIERYEASREPLNDRLTKAQARQYVARYGYGRTQLQRWEDEGLLEGRKSGESYNSPVYYSRSAIATLLCSLSLKKAIVENLGHD